MQATTKSKAGKGLAAILSDAPVSNGQPSLVFIELSQIMPNSLNPRKEFAEADLNDLADSIKKLGVIQAITVRPARSRGTYELICGERRYKAAIIAGLITIPAVIRDISDAEAMELMITENLQRKDVHPLEEANAFQYMLDKMGYTITDVAAKIGKNEPFVVRRLQLKELVSGLKNLFIKNELSIGHAELLCRISGADQESWLAAKFTQAYMPGQGTIKDLRQWLKGTENILSNAPFRIDDIFKGKQFVCATCINCPKNSAFNNNLFPDAQENAVCFDSRCYQAKDNFAFDKVLELALNDPEIVLIQDSYGDHDLVKQLKKDGHKVYKYWDDYSKLIEPTEKKGYNETDKQAKERYDRERKVYLDTLPKTLKGFNLVGKDRGTVYDIILKGAAAVQAEAPTDAESLRKKLVADGIMKRMRGLELDAEKVMQKQVDVLKKISFVKQIDPNLNEISSIESNALLCIAWQKCGYNTQKDIMKKLNLNGDYLSDQKVFEVLLTAPDYIKSFIIRNAIFQNFSGIQPKGINGAVITALTEHWAQPEFNQINADQATIRTKRESNLDKKLKDFDKNILTVTV